MEKKKYRTRIVRGAFVDPAILDELGAKVIESLDDEWQSIDEVIVDIDQVKELQKAMVKHYADPDVPWYMDGRSIDDSNEIIVAFGADDGSGGKIFVFNKDDEKSHKEVVKYGASKGIPESQMDFLEVKF